MPGKIDASLNEKLQSVKWGEYKLCELFEIKTTKSIDKNKVVFDDKGIIEFIGRSSLNNGVQGKLNKLPYEPNPADTFSLVQVGESICLFRKNKWYASQNIFILSPKNKALATNQIFVTAAINKALYLYKNAYVYPTLEDVKNQEIKLPIIDKNINFDFMEKFVAELEARRVAELEARRVAELEAYLLATGLKDYTLTKEEEKVLNDYSSTEFIGFNIIEAFNVKNTSNILSCEIIEGSGHTPYLCASAENNGVSSYISYNEKYKEKGNCIFIGGKTFVVSYQEKDFFSNDSHNLALYLKEKNCNKLKHLYLATCIYKSLSYKYSWGDSISKTKIQKDVIFLPVKDGKPDYEIMDTFVSAIQKLVIKDVVLYVDKKIEATKKIVK